MKPQEAERWGEKASGTVVSGPLVVWIGLLLLLAINIGLTLLPLGAFKTPLNIAIATIQVTLMGVVFMRLNRSSPLVRLTAVAGFLWVSFLFIFALADFLTRP
jgi:caa(3)-type oxidase subunit IV